MTIPPLHEIWQAGVHDGDRVPLSYESAEVGRELGPVAYVLDPATVAAYASVMGIAAPLFPTVPARHTGILRDRAYAVDGGGINARTEYEFFSTPRVGDIIVVTGGVVHRYVRRGKPYVVQMAEARNAEGALLERVKLTEMRDRPAVAAKWSFLAGDEE